MRMGRWWHDETVTLAMRVAMGNKGLISVHGV